MSKNNFTQATASNTGAVTYVTIDVTLPGPRD